MFERHTYAAMEQSKQDSQMVAVLKLLQQAQFFVCYRSYIANPMSAALSYCCLSKMLFDPLLYSRAPVFAR